MNQSCIDGLLESKVVAVAATGVVVGQHHHLPLLIWNVYVTSKQLFFSHFELTQKHSMSLRATGSRNALCVVPC